jgi:hypothetical protein
MFLNPRTTGRQSFDSVLVRLACLGRAQVHKTEAPEDCVPIELCALTVYKFDHSAVDGNPEARFKCLKKMVGERGFEPPTPWSRTWGQRGNFVAIQSFEWCFNRFSLAESCQFGVNVNPPIATLARDSTEFAVTSTERSQVRIPVPAAASRR